MALLELSDARVVLGEPPRTILHGISLAIESGSITLVVGRNGSGKSVLLRAMLGLVPLAGGTIRFDGIRLDGRFAKLHRSVGALFQDPDTQIFGDTVREDLTMTLAEQSPFPADLCERFGLADRLDDPPVDLSGGNRRMLALAAALVHDPPLLLLDEPIAELDWGAIETVRNELRRRAANGTAVVLSAHDTRDLWDLADQVVLLQGGRVAAGGAPAEVAGWITPESGLHAPR